MEALPNRFYHGTKPSLIEKILKEGLLPSYMGAGWEGKPEKRKHPAVSLTSDIAHAKVYSNLGATQDTDGLLSKIKASLSKHPILEINIPKDVKLPEKAWSIPIGDRNMDEYHFPAKIPPEWISVVKEAQLKTPLLDGIYKVSGSVLREAVGFRYDPFIEGAEDGTWKMFFKKKPTDTIGEIMIKGKPGEPARIIHSDIVSQWRGKGLGKKMYGEVIRRHPVVVSDTALSPHSFNTWKGLARRSSKTGLNVKKLLPVKPAKLAKGAHELFHVSAPGSIFAAQPTKASQIGKFLIPKFPKASLLKKLLAKITNMVELKGIAYAKRLGKV